MTDLDTKRCARCCLVQTIDAFSSSKQTRDGLFPYCRECKRAAQRADAVKHKEVRSVKAAARYAANPEPYKKRSREQYRKDPARWKASSVDWNRRNPESHKAASRAWMKRNPGPVREAVRRRAATRKGAKAIIFTRAQLEQRMAYWGNRCWCCGGFREAVDHVKPLTKGGAHMLCNLRPICKSCNSSKNDTWPLHNAARVSRRS